MHFKSEQEWKQNLLTTEERGAGTHPAVLMALDAKTGKLLYQSGDAMKSWNHFGGLAIDDGKIYSVDHSSKLYCFGLRDH
jgi:outer membrane protein assembly factor BamB